MLSINSSLASLSLLLDLGLSNEPVLEFGLLTGVVFTSVDEALVDLPRDSVLGRTIN
jgi:hypothetical protein